MRTWQIQEAKARLSEVVKLAVSEGPQDITVHGRSAAVILSREEYERLAGVSGSLAEFMKSSPLHGVDDLVIRRNRTPTRENPL